MNSRRLEDRVLLMLGFALCVIVLVKLGAAIWQLGEWIASGF